MSDKVDFNNEMPLFYHDYDTSTLIGQQNNAFFVPRVGDLVDLDKVYEVKSVKHVFELKGEEERQFFGPEYVVIMVKEFIVVT